MVSLLYIISRFFTTLFSKSKKVIKKIGPAKKKDAPQNIFFYKKYWKKKVMVMVILSATVERFSVSRMRDFF